MVLEQPSSSILTQQLNRRLFPSTTRAAETYTDGKGRKRFKGGARMKASQLLDLNPGR